MLKERRKLVLVARDTPLSLIHLENMAAVTRAGAVVLPAIAVVLRAAADASKTLLDTVVGRVLDHLGLPIKLGPRWGEEENVDERSIARGDRAPGAFAASRRRPASSHSQLLSPDEPESDDVDEWVTLDVEVARRASPTPASASCCAGRPRRCTTRRACRASASR